jgi:hypothetical protein
MTTIVLLVTLALAILVAPLTTEAQQATQVHRIGLLYSSPASPAPIKARHNILYLRGE